MIASVQSISSPYVYCLCLLSQVCGNLISSLILQEAGNGPQFNETNAFCGANSTVNDTNATGIHDSIRYTLLSVYMAFDLAGKLQGII